MLRAIRFAAAPLAGIGVAIATTSRDAPKATTPLPPVLRKSFAPPEDGFFVAGTLTVTHHLPPINFLQQHVLGIVPPAGQQRTVVRHTVDGQSGTVLWLRLFGDAQSTFSTLWTMDGPAEPASERFAGVVDIAQRLECSTAPGGGLRATLRHESTSLLGVVPLPRMLLVTNCVMDVCDDGTGYDLCVEVTLAGLPMVTYSGRLRECTGRPSEFLSAREAAAMRAVNKG